MAGQDEVIAYSNALFKMAKGDGKLLDYQEDFEAFLYIYKENSDLNRFVNSPRIKKDEKKSFIKKVLDGKLSEPFLAFVNVLIQKRVINKLEKIFLYYRKLVDRENNIARGRVLSVKDVEQSKMDNLAKLLSDKMNKKVILTNHIKEDILGGLVVEFEDKKIDMSVAQGLENLKNKILSNKI